LQNQGVTIITNARVKDLLINDNICEGALLEDGRRLFAKKLFLLPAE